MNGGGNTTDAVVPTNSNVVCFTPLMLSMRGIWGGQMPNDFALSLFLIQLSLVVLTTRILQLAIRPFRQPRVLAEIIGGIVLGPSVLGQIHGFHENIFPPRSMVTLETLANLGLLFFLFLIGVETDIMVIKRMGQKAMVIAVAGMVLPFSIGVATSFIFRRQISHNVHEGPFLLFLGVALSVTAFPVLARILAEIKLLNTELGRISMSSAIMNDLCAWALLAVATALAEHHKTALSSLGMILSGIGFVLLCFYVVRPAICWLIRRMPEGDGVSDFYVCLILSGVMLSSFATDVIGINAVFGAFVFGLVIPSGAVAEALVDKLQDFVNGLLLPLFFVFSGLRTDVSTFSEPATVGLLVLVFVLASVGKIIGTVLISMYYNMPFREGLSLGLLMNTRGIIEMIILNIGRDKMILDDAAFAVMVIMSVLITSIVTPVVTSVYHPAKILLSYKRRNLQRAKPDTELRMLVCVHTPRHVPSVISLLEISNPTKRSPIFVYALHLVELTGRGSVMLKPVGVSTSLQSNTMLKAFESFEQRAGGVSVQRLTAMSPHSTMHEDICGLAADKHVSFIVLPFHKQPHIDGGLEETNHGVRTVNSHVLTHSPCSVGILIDRGLSGGGLQRAGPISQHFTHHVAVLFFGGPNDREALAYAWRLADHPSIGLAVFRFLPDASSPTAIFPSTTSAFDPRVVTVVTSEDRERELDDEYFSEFRLKTLSNESVTYTEKVVSSSEDTVHVIRNMESIYDLYVVGREQGEGAVGQLTAGLTEWSDCPELGPIGDLLASSDFTPTASVLIVQQYSGGMTDSPKKGPKEETQAFNGGWNERERRN